MTAKRLKEPDVGLDSRPKRCLTQDFLHPCASTVVADAACLADLIGRAGLRCPHVIDPLWDGMRAPGFLSVEVGIPVLVTVALAAFDTKGRWGTLAYLERRSKRIADQDSVLTPSMAAVHQAVLVVLSYIRFRLFEAAAAQKLRIRG